MAFLRSAKRLHEVRRTLGIKWKNMDLNSRAGLQFTRTVHQDVYPSIDPTKAELSLAGKVVIVTGASRGIGARGFAPAFAKAGVKGLVLVARNAEMLQ